MGYIHLSDTVEYKCSECCSSEVELLKIDNDENSIQLECKICGETFTDIAPADLRKPDLWDDFLAWGYEMKSDYISD